MSKSLLPVVHCLSRLAGSPADDLSDAELLDRFRNGGEDAAFTLLVQRHGPAVRGVCRRVLGHAADADDAFQATFLVLLRKAKSVRRADSLGCWLYGVAYRVAVKARSRRRATVSIGESDTLSGSEPAEQAARRELVAVLDEEIRGLPEKYRAPFVLCVLEEATYEQAARELASSKSSVARRLEQARELLRQKLTLRGVGVAGAVAAAVLTEEVRAAAVPALLTLQTVRLARQAAAGRTTSVAAERLAEQVVRGTTTARRLAVLGLSAVLGLVAASAGLFGGFREAPPAVPPADAPPAAGAAVRTDREGFPLPAGALARVGSARLRHGRPSPHIEYSPDGSLLASSGGGLVRLWEARTGKLVWQRTLSGVGRIPDGFFTADGKSVVVLDGQICRWLDARNGKEVRNCEVKVPEGNAACLAPRGEAVAVADLKGRGDLVLYDLPSGKERFRQTAEGRWLGQMLFSPDGKTLLAREEGGGPLLAVSLRRLDVVAGRSLGALHPREYNGLAFAPDGQAVVGHDGGSRVAVTAVPGGQYLQWFDTRVPGLVIVAYAPDGKSLVVAGQGPEVHRLDLKTWKLLREYRTGPRCSSLAFTPDGKTLAVAAGDGLITQWDLATGKRLAASAEPLNGFWYPRFDASGKLLWACSDSFVTMNWRTGGVVRRVPLPGSSSLIDVDIWPRPRAGGKSVAWDTRAAEDLCAFTDPLTEDCKRVFSGGSASYKFPLGSPISYWCRLVEKGLPAPDAARSLPDGILSRDGLLLATDNREKDPNGGREVILYPVDKSWPPKTRELPRLSPPGDGRVRDIAFSQDGNFLAAVGQASAAGGAKAGFLTLWDVKTGAAKFARTGLPDEFVCLTFSEDGKLLATGGEGGALRLWDASTGAERRRFTGHLSAVYSVGFSPDGKLLAAASADAPLFVWDVEAAAGRPASDAPSSGK